MSKYTDKDIGKGKAREKAKAKVKDRGRDTSLRTGKTRSGKLPGGRRLGRRELIILLIPVLTAVAAVAAVMLTVSRGTSYKLKRGASQYYGGNRSAIEAGTSLKRSSSGITLLEHGGQSIQTGLPIYLSDSSSVILPDDMLYFAPRSGECLRLVYFSEVECKANGTVIARHDDATKTIDPGFLYDGRDFYLFLEPVVLTFNGYTMELPALSYAEAVYGGHIMVFNYETKETFTEVSDGVAEARTPAGDYTISLFGDSMTLYDGSKSLLATKADLFDPVI